MPGDQQWWEQLGTRLCVCGIPGSWQEAKGSGFPPGTVTWVLYGAGLLCT